MKKILQLQSKNVLVLLPIYYTRLSIKQEVVQRVWKILLKIMQKVWKILRKIRQKVWKVLSKIKKKV